MSPSAFPAFPSEYPRVCGDFEHGKIQGVFPDNFKLGRASVFHAANGDAFRRGAESKSDCGGRVGLDDQNRSMLDASCPSFVRCVLGRHYDAVFAGSESDRRQNRGPRTRWSLICQRRGQRVRRQ